MADFGPRSLEHGPKTVSFHSGQEQPSRHFGGPCDKNMANNTNARQPMLSRVADVVSGMKSEKCPIFQDYSIQFFGKKNTSCSETYTALTHFEFNKLTKTVCDKMTLFPVVMAWNGVTGYLAGRGACLSISG